MVPAELGRFIGLSTAVDPDLPLDRMQERFLKALSAFETGSRQEICSAIKELDVLDALQEELVILFLRETSRLRTGEGENRAAELAAKCRDLETDLLEVDGWLRLFHLALRNGLLEPAVTFRNHATRRAYKGAGEGDPDDCEAAFRAAVDRGEFDKAERLLNRIREYGRLQSRTLGQYTCYFLLAAGSREEAAGTAERQPDYSIPFRKYVEGRSVAVVGPAASEERHGTEIDQFDIVVRMNYGRDSRISEPAKYGSRSDVAYYNQEFLNHMKSHGEYDFLKELDFAVFKSRIADLPHELRTNDRIRRPMGVLKYFSGFPNLGQLIIGDLMLYRPSRVKLFYMNFYLARNSYHNSYFTAHDFEGENHLRSFAHHDCFSQINFTRHLWDAGLIEADPVCREVLQLDPEEYLEALKRIYVRGE